MLVKDLSAIIILIYVAKLIKSRFFKNKVFYYSFIKIDSINYIKL